MGALIVNAVFVFEVHRVSGDLLLALLLLGCLGGIDGLLLGKQHRVDVGQHTTSGNGHVAQKDVKLFIVPNLTEHCMMKMC